MTNTKQLQEINWIDAQTRSVTLLTLLISPQPASVADILTLLQVLVIHISTSVLPNSIPLQVTFDKNQVGAWKTNVKLFSVSQTLDTWYTLTSVTLVYAACYFILSLIKLYRRWAAELDYKGELLNVVSTIFVFASLLWLLLVDKAPPDVFEELMKAFRANSTEQYFIVMGIINTCMLQWI